MDQKMISPEVRRPINRRLGLDIGEDVSGELDALKEELTEMLRLAEPLNYSNPKHVAHIVFGILGVRPRATEGVPLPTKARPRNLARLQARRNVRREPIHCPSSLHFPLFPRFAPIDFDAELPELPFADATPSELPLEQLVFYRDEHPLIRKLCRYQALWRRRLACVTSERYH